MADIFSAVGPFMHPGDWRISFSANLSSPIDAFKPNPWSGETDNLPSWQKRILRLRLAFILQARFPKAEKNTHPRGLEVQN